jgi:hypothetical protein
MDEEFSSLPDLTDQPISHPDIEYLQMAAVLSWTAHVLQDMQ